VAASPSAPRLAALDAARALGVVAMVFGHTLDALLSPAARVAPGMQAYWAARGLTLPLFLTVSGWAVAMAITRGSARGLAIPRGRLPRVLLLLAVGYALRWPGWDVAGLWDLQPYPWAHFLAFDALHLIAVCLLLASLVLALPWRPREQALLFGALAVLAIAVGLRPPAPLLPEWWELPSDPSLVLVQAFGGNSPFPLLPWSAHFFSGAVVGLAARAEARRTLFALAAIGAVLVVSTCWTGVETMPIGHPLLMAFRTGVVLLVLAALSRVPQPIARRLAPLGRASLGVYAIHVPIVYGWSSIDGLATRVGQSLTVGQSLLAAAAVLAASYAVHRALALVRIGAAAAVARVRGRGAHPGAAGGASA
jgi:acyltransferase